MPNVLDLEQALLLLEISPPFGKRDVQVARRRMAKVWHPDIAPPGKQYEHERHLKAINEALELVGRLVDRLEVTLVLELLARWGDVGKPDLRLPAPRELHLTLVEGGLELQEQERLLDVEDAWHGI